MKGEGWGTRRKISSVRYRENVIWINREGLRGRQREKVKKGR